jgi:hypothetical protein
MTVGSCTSSKASERAKRALPVVEARPISRSTPTTAMSTPVEMRWRRFWAVSTRVASVRGEACSTVSRLTPDLPQASAQAPEPTGLEEGNDLAPTQAPRRRHDERLGSTVVK